MLCKVWISKTTILFPFLNFLPHSHTVKWRQSFTEIHTDALFPSHTLTNRDQNTGRPWDGTGSQRGMWVFREGTDRQLNPLRGPSSFPWSSRRPCCPGRNPRSLSAQRARQRKGRAAGPRIATAERSNVATFLIEAPEKTQRNESSLSVNATK